jgi:hypothetical protein
MAEQKYKKYIVEDYMKGDEQVIPNVTDFRKTIVGLTDNQVKGAFYAGFVWYLQPFQGTGPNSTSSHTHDFDELLGFLGSDWENPESLNAEIEFWLEDEKYILTKSCVIFVPKGMSHCPLKMLTCKRPVFHFGVAPEQRVTKLTRK